MASDHSCGQQRCDCRRRGRAMRHRSGSLDTWCATSVRNKAADTTPKTFASIAMVWSCEVRH